MSPAYGPPALAGSMGCLAAAGFATALTLAPAAAVSPGLPLTHGAAASALVGLGAFLGATVALFVAVAAIGAWLTGGRR